MKYLLDTNICIYMMRQKPLSVTKKINEMMVGDLAISTVTLSELYYGVSKSQQVERNRAVLEQFILPLEVLPYSDLAAEYYGMFRAQLEKQGTPIGPLDLMIAAHAKSLHYTLVTHNTKEFNRLPDLMVEDWVSDTVI